MYGMTYRYCKCGTQIRESGRPCPNCGSITRRPKLDFSDLNKFEIGLLSILLVAMAVLIWNLLS